jgi:signal transduction histidine kinase
LLSDRLQGGLWLGFVDGGIAYLKDGQIRSSYNVADGLGNGEVNDLQSGSDGAVWAATEGGLSRVKDHLVTTLTSRNGLPCDAVNSVIEDNDHSFWLYMPCGLVRIARSELEGWMSDQKGRVRTTLFDSSDGVRSRALAGAHSRLVSKSPDGRIWISRPDGVSVIDPRHLPFNKLPPPVHIEQVTANGKEYGAARGLRLPPRVRDVWINYTALSFVAPEKVRFRYKLEGQDPDWIEVVNDRQVQYSNLKPRRYRFRVIACNNSGVWNETGDTLDFSVEPAYYQTNWFLAACVAAGLGVLWALYRYRLHQVAQEFNARLEERVGERTRIARELHDTLLQSFQGLMLRFQIVDDLLPEGKAKEALEKALERADQAIAEGRDSIHDLRSSTVITNDLADAVRSLGDELASQDSATFGVVVEGQQRSLHPILRDEIYRIAREAVRNAFRHAQARRIEAEITYSDKLLRLRIRDDGRGLDPGIGEEGVAGHYGLAGMRERATQIGAQLHIWSGSGAGTEIELSIPGAIAYGTAPARTWFWPFRRRTG